MEPLEIVGATAAIAQLLKLALDIGDQARQLVQSFVHAPRQLKELSAKLDRLRFLLDHVHQLDGDLTSANSTELLPETHKSLLYNCLQVNLAALEKLRSLHDDQNHPRAVQRLRWATVDKRKAQHILEDLKASEADLDVVLSVLGVRLAFFNRISNSAVQLGQEALRTDITNHFQELGACFQAQTVMIETRAIETSTATLAAIQRFNQEQSTSSSEISNLLTQIALSQARTETQIKAHHQTQVQIATNVSRIEEIAEELGRKEHQPNAFNKAQAATTVSAAGSRSSGESPAKHSFLAQPSQSTSYSDLFSAIEERAQEYYWRGAVTKQSWIFESDDRKRHAEPATQFTASLDLTSRRSQWKARAALRARVNILGQRIIHLEITGRQFARSWMSMPTLSSWISVANVRQDDAPIFQACRREDLSTVRRLIETGEAHIHDIDTEGRGLLEQVIFGTKWLRKGNKTITPPKTKLLLRYLLDYGCNPNGDTVGPVIPAVLLAFHAGAKDAVSTLLCHGAQLDGFRASPATFLTNLGGAFRWQLRLLRSTGFSDWKPAGQYTNLLNAAVRAAEVPEILFALEDLGIDPNIDFGFGTALRNAKGNAFLCSLLFEAGAEIGPREVLQSLERGCNNIAHWFLSCGIDVTFRTSRCRSAWHAFWEKRRGNIVRRRRRIDFVRLEGVLSHLHWHGSDPNEGFRAKQDSRFWCDDSGWERAPDFARTLSYTDQYLFHNIMREQAASASDPVGDPPHTKEDASKWSRQEGRPQFLPYWSLMGCLIYLDPDRLCHEEDNESQSDTETFFPLRESCVGYMDGEMSNDIGSVFYRKRPFMRTTLFFDTVSTHAGRRQLARFPFVRLLVNTLQLAGYRAEMDDEGDVWYEDEDGDQYFDAREFQPHADADDDFVENCPICQNPEKYGLRHIFKEAKRGRKILQKYRRRKARERAGRRP